MTSRGPLALRPLLLVSLAALASACAGTQRAAGPEFRVRRTLAEQLAAQGDWGGAFRAADALVAEAPNDVPARLLRARALRRAGAAAEAESDLVRVLRQDPGNAVAHGELGMLCEGDGRQVEALHHHREALRLAPGDARAANNLGFALLVRGENAEATAVLEEALRLHPGDARLRNNLGFAYAAKGDLDRAARQFALGGTAAESRHNLALAYERRNDLPRAFELYLQAARLEGGQRLPRANLVHLSRVLGRPLPPEAGSAADEPKGAP